MIRTIAWTLFGLIQAGPKDGSFAADEVAKIVEYWSTPGRYEASTPASTSGKGRWQVRLTPEGSKWLWDYNRARGLSKGAPSQVPAARNPEEATWESWIESKVAYDRSVAGAKAAQENGQSADSEAVRKAKEAGPMPDSLRRLMPEPPVFANAVEPRQHTVRFADHTVTLIDNPNMRPRYAYYRFPEGVMSGGTAVKSMDSAELDGLFEKAGVSSSARSVMKSVSLLEGGFDAVNTYDTGFVSVGFIQFACLSGGAGSLGALLKVHKAGWPADFQSSFRQFGIDVDATGRLVALDPTSGDERVGPDAAAAIIRDKRLIAVFQRAGRLCESFRIAQIQTAHRLYYPSEQEIEVSVGGKQLSGTAGEIIRSEAGLATLMDRKVNTGTLDPMKDILAEIASQNPIESFADFAVYERDILAALKYRKDYLADALLTQPGPQIHPNRSYLPSRHRPRRGG